MTEPAGGIVVALAGGSARPDWLEEGTGGTRLVGWLLLAERTNRRTDGRDALSIRRAVPHICKIFPCWPGQWTSRWASSRWLRPTDKCLQGKP